MHPAFLRAGAGGRDGYPEDDVHPAPEGSEEEEADEEDADDQHVHVEVAGQAGGDSAEDVVVLVAVEFPDGTAFAAGVPVLSGAVARGACTSGSCRAVGHTELGDYPLYEGDVHYLLAGGQGFGEDRDRR